MTKTPRTTKDAKRRTVTSLAASGGWKQTQIVPPTSLPMALSTGNPEIHFPKVGGSDNVCQDVLKGLLGEPVLIPLFSSAINGGGSKTQYTLIGFAAFQVTGYKFGGGPGLTHNDTSAPSCTGMCRGLQGFFTRFVTLDEGRIAGGGAPNFGASKVELTG